MRRGCVRSGGPARIGRVFDPPRSTRLPGICDPQTRRAGFSCRYRRIQSESRRHVQPSSCVQHFPLMTSAAGRVRWGLARWHRGRGRFPLPGRSPSCAGITCREQGLGAFPGGGAKWGGWPLRPGPADRVPSCGRPQAALRFPGILRCRRHDAVLMPRTAQ